jgi:hypothetical protein
MYYTCHTGICMKLVNRCEYPGCTIRANNYRPVRVCYQHSCYVKILDCYFNSTDYIILSNIWYIKKFTSINRTASFHGKSMLSQILYLDEYSVVEYIKNGSRVLIIMYTPSRPDWYIYDGIIDNICYNFDSFIYQFTYKRKLYEMRTAELYFGAIPKDVLDEVIIN